MAKTISLLLTENVDNLGIVGDIVNVKLGYARNYLLPMDLATTPSDEAVAALTEKRKEAERQHAELRTHREKMVGKLDGLEITLERACNDLGHLYGSVTQQDIAAALDSVGFPVKPREVRLPHIIKRLDSYEIPIKFDADLEATLKLWVIADRELGLDEREEMEFDNEGNLIEKPPAPKPVEKDADEAKS